MESFEHKDSRKSVMNLKSIYIIFNLRHIGVRITRNSFLLGFLVSITALSLSISSLEARTYSFRNFSTSDGLSHTMINCMMQDTLGFIWIGTSDGLNRFDGYSFKKYYSKSHDSLSLENNNINALAEDFRGRIWLATGTGFFYFSPVDETFRKVKFQRNEYNKLAEDICVDATGTVWGVDNSNVLIRINANTDMSGEIFQLDSLLGRKASLYNRKLLFAHGYIWVLSSAGVIRFDSQTMTAELVQSDQPFQSPRFIRKGNRGELFVVDWNAGVYRLNTKAMSLKPYMQAQISDATNGNMGVTDIDYFNGEAWILSYPGVCKISDSGSIEKFNTASGYGRDYDKSIFFTSLRDREGNLWLGTQDEGVFLVSENEDIFNRYSVHDSGNRGLPASQFLIHGNEIFLCNVYGTYYRKMENSPADGHFSKITKGVSVAVSKYNDNEYLLFEKNKVTAFNTHTKQIGTVMEVSDMHNGMVDSKGTIWTAHWGYGMDGYNPRTKKRYHIDAEKDDKSINVIFSILEDTDGSLWLGSFGAGLLHVQHPHAENPTITKYIHTQDGNSINNNFITSLYDDGKGTLWVGTNGGGLHQFNKTANTFQSFTTADGLRGNVIQSIVGDNDGNIWFATNVITKYDIQKHTFTHFEKSVGIDSKFFTLDAQKSSDGTLYFGDDRGILYFNPADIEAKPIAPVPHFSAVRLSGQTIEANEEVNGYIPFPKSIAYADTIILPHYLNSFSFEFASIQVDNAENISYSYRLSGIDNQWVNSSSSERLASYAGLPQGTYTFEVRASSEPGKWSKSRILTVIITPPWWETVWFQFSAVLLLAGIIAIYVLNLKRRNQSLERIVQKRTGELQKSNVKLEEERVVVEMKNKYLNEVLESKAKLMKIIAHDFKNPLNGILGMSELLNEESIKLNLEKVTKYTGIITSSAHSLVNQMVSMLDWSLSEEENLEACPIEINAMLLLNDAIDLVTTSASQKQISIESFNDCTSNVLVDPRMGSMIFRNLLTNAIKFTPKNGAISVIVKELPQKITISFIDNGIGIKQEIVDQVMSGDASIQSTLGTENEIGTGFGLRLCKKFLSKNNGTLSVTSAERQGSVFIVSLPKGTSAFVPQKQHVLGENAPDENDATESAVKYTVLVVDDNEDIRQTIQATLEGKYDIVQASNGLDALNIAGQILPDIIISDINMDGMSGIELCTHIKKHTKTFHIPIILVSSHKTNDIKDQAFSAGANDYIEKPFNTFHLLKKVESLLVLRAKISDKARSEMAAEVFPDLATSYESEILKKIDAFIEENIGHEKLNTNIVAEELEISRAQLWRIFKKETGYTLSDYIKEKKLQKASAMLLTEKYRVSEIGYGIGFADPRYFSRWFQKERGMTPTQFVKKMKHSGLDEPANDSESE